MDNGYESADMQNDTEQIAIIAMSGRFPGARDIESFWENLKAGVSTVSRFTDQELLEAGIDPEVIANPAYVKARPVLEDVDLFDAEFFGVTPKDAEVMDPQHRVFLECAWEALERGGYDTESYRGAIGIFAGQSLNTYLLANLCADRDVIRELTGGYQVGSYPTVLGNDKDYLTTRVSYKLNLRGPGVTVQSACSTSLVAICQAAQSLLNYQCDMALAGGVSITFPQTRGYLYQEGGMVSPDGTCRAFDRDAQGTIFGSGAGVVLLKRLSEAVADGDTILAVLKGYALNNDGSRKVSYMAPSVDGQAEVIRDAHAMAGVDAESISYVETHGTGTPLGDPIEVAGLTQAFRAATEKTGFCAIGSVKTNVGHLEVAAGVTGFIKTVLSLRHGVLPPSLNYNQANAAIDFGASPFQVNSALREWQTDGTPRRAGVSAFGVGGTNAHVVLEEAPELEPSLPMNTPHLLLLSAKTPAALDRMTANLAEHLRRNPDINMADAAYTLQVGRRSFGYRKAFVCRDREDAVRALESAADALTAGPVSGTKSIAFLFPGQGAQSVGMASGLYQSDSKFRAHLDTCAEVLEPELGLDLRSVIHPRAEEREAAQTSLDQTRITQPALFAIEYALARWWQENGVQPQVMLGHSIGEYVAACLAGVFTPQDALKLIAARGRLVQTLPAGAMLAVRRTPAEVEPLLSAEICLAAVNSPSSSVLSGPTPAIEALQARLEADGVACRRLRTSHAFHSAMLDPILPEFERLVRSVPLSAPTIPYISNVTGTWITAEEAVDSTYWVRHLRGTVLFSDGIRLLLETPGMVMMEVGPGRVLSALAKQQGVPSDPGAVIASLGAAEDAESEPAVLQGALGRLWLAGVEPLWSTAYKGTRRVRIPLPTYPFERKRYWRDAPERTRLLEDPTLSRNSSTLPSAPGAASNGAAHHAPAVSAALLLIPTLKSLLQEASGVDLQQVSDTTSFLEMGYDSLFLTQACLLFQKQFKVKITFRQLMGDLSTLGSLAEYIASKAAPEALPAPVPQERKAETAVANPTPADNLRAADPIVPPQALAAAGPQVQAAVSGPADSGLAAIVQQQLDLMARQLELLRSGSTALLQNEIAQPPAAAPVTGSESGSGRAGLPQPGLSQAAKAAADFQAFGPYKPINKHRSGALTRDEQTYLDGLIARYTKRTAESKRLAQLHRASHADPRAVSGFRAEWKEMVYPITVERSSGSKLWDVDGNEYVDMLNGFGVTMFGHSPAFVTEAVERQLKLGVEIGPQTPLAGQVAALIHEFTGLDRACFCNTGSEAVMAAIRLARTVTGRDKIVLFTGSYHGTFDEVLVRANPGQAKLSALPIAPGIPAANVENVIVLEYGSPEALEVIKAQTDDLAAVLVETVQSRHPDLQPREFLHELRRITEASGTALIFDEVVTGFRVHPGGVQALFGIRADMATYGKVIGGGFPIGILAGRKEFMDALDGGAWQYGDDSFPEVGVTFHAGTFVRHPLAMAAAWAVLNHLKASGPALQERLNARAAIFAGSLNAFFEKTGVPTRIRNFGSVLFFKFPGDLRYAGLFYYALRLRGVHIYEGFPFFLTTAHTDADLETVIQAFKEATQELQDAGFLPTVSQRLVSVSDSGRNGNGGTHRDSVGSNGAHKFPESLAANGYSSDAGPVGNGGNSGRNGGHPANGRLADALPSAPSEDRAPITEAQKEIWLSAQMSDEASCAYNESCSLRLRGRLDLDALRGAVQALADRHDALRATFSPDGNWQQFASRLAVDVPVIDIEELDSSSQKLRLESIVADDATTPFNLVDGPLVRLQLVRLAQEEHHLQFTAHHIICDGWSIGVLLRELSSLYTARVRGTAAEMAETMQFSDYARIVDQERTSVEAADDEAYWTSQYRDPVHPLDLPTDRPLPPVKSFNGSMERATLDRTLVEDLKRVSARQGATLFSTLLAGFSALLHRLSCQSDFVIGIPAAGQSTVGSPSLVGHCLNFLPLRNRVEEAAPFSQLAAEVKERVLDAYEHQNYTYGTLVRALDLPRDAARLPLLNVMFNIDPEGMDRLPFDGLECTVENNAKRFTNMDLFLNIYKCDGELRLECDFNTDLFDRATVQRWLGLYASLLSSIVSDPSQRIASLPLLTEADRRKLLIDWNATQTPYPSEAGVHELVAEQARKTPDAVAVTFERQTLTYAQLDQQADALARRLAALGVEREVRVGLLAERSLEMVVALLAIAKAGGAYVPLDPQYPARRIEYILADAKVPVLVTQSHLAENLARGEAEIVLLGEETTGAEATNLPGSAGGYPLGAPASSLAPSRLGRGLGVGSSAGGEDLAYVIYTSGSTGNPKGVQISHRALINLLCSMKERPGLTQNDTLAAVTTLSFDIAGLEIWLPLITGARLVLVSRETSMDGGKLNTLLQAEQVSVLQATPATWRLLLAAGWQGSPQLKALCGGEALPLELAQQIRARCGSLWNMYGPTETTIWSTVMPIETGDREVLIGRPIANTQAYILNGEMNPVPIGVAGELYLGGDGLARGYLNRAELTAEKFLPDPFSADKTARLYRTGDLARYHADGNIEFLGRIDNQVKIRGFRIELGEIEATLKACPEVSDCIVTVWKGGTDEAALVAYAVLRDPHDPTNAAATIDSLRRAMGRTLPEVMHPSRFVFLEALPLTPNGKLDRKALPEPDWAVPNLAKESVAPRTREEKILSDIWSDVLRIEQVGVTDDFFHLGGNSMHVLQIVSRARLAGIDLVSRQVFAHRTIADIAASLGAADRPESSFHAPPITRAARRLVRIGEESEKL